MTRLTPTLLFIFALIVATACAQDTTPPSEQPKLAGEIEIHYIDVGQGSAALIRTPSGHNIVFDGGTPRDTALHYLQTQGVQHVDIVIASHAHADHIGGLANIIEHYQPTFYVDNGIPHTTKTYERLLNAVLTSGTQLLEAEGQTIGLGDTSLTLLPAPGIQAWGHNDNSIGALIRFGEFTAAFTGDAEAALFEWWAEHHADLFEAYAPITAYEAAHHGSRNGDSTTSMNLIQPHHVFISHGLDNSYGHPHQEALNLYQAAGATTYGTVDYGHMKLTSDSNANLTLHTERKPH